MLDCSWVLSWTFVGLFSVRGATPITGSSSPMLKSSVFFVRSRDKVSPAWCLAPDQWTMSILHLISRKCHLASLLVASPKSRVYFKAWRSVRTVNLAPSRYKRWGKIALTNARHSWWVVSRLLLRSFKIIDQYPISFSTLLYCSCNSTHRNWQSHAFVSRVYRPYYRGKAKIRGAICFSCNVWNIIGSSSCSYPRSFACNLRSLVVYRNAMRAKLRCKPAEYISQTKDCV